MSNEDIVGRFIEPQPESEVDCIREERPRMHSFHFSPGKSNRSGWRTGSRVISPLTDSYIFVDQDCGIGTCHMIPPPTVTPASFVEMMPRSGLHLCCVHDGIAHDMVTESGLTGTGGLLPKHGSEGYNALVVTTVTKSTA